MQFTVNRDVILSALSDNLGAVQSSAEVAHLSFARFKITGLQMVIESSNLEIAIRTKVTLESNQDSQGSSFYLPAAKFHSWLALTAPGSIVKCKLTSSKFTASVGRTVCNIQIVDGVSLPELPPLGKEFATVSAKDLSKMFSAAAIVAWNAQHNINGSLIKVNHESGEVVVSAASSNRGLVAVAPASSPKSFSGLLAKRCLLEVSKACKSIKDDSPVKIFVGQNHLYFAAGKSLIYARQLGGRFPDMSRALPKPEDQKVITVNSKELESCLGRVILFSESDKGNYAQFSINGELKISSQALAGDNSEAIPCTSVTPELEMSIGANSAWVLDAARIIDGDIDFCVTAPDRPMEFRPHGRRDLRYVIAHMSKT